MASFYEELHKSDSISDEKENAQSRKGIDTWIFRLLLVLLGVMPLIVLANIEEVLSPLVSNISSLSSGVKGELFTHFKSFFVLVITVITGVMLLLKLFFMGGTLRKTVLNYFIGLFVIAIVLSTIFSPNISIAINGQYNRSDGAISWLCYAALLFIAMNIEYPKKAVNYVMYALMPLVYINLFIITMNFYGKDILQQAWLQKVISMALPEGSSISEGSMLVGTLNQWNYMSGMFAILTVMFLARVFIEKSWAHTIAGAVTAAAAISVMFMSISTSGFLTVLVSLVVLLVILVKSTAKKNALVSLAIFLVITAPVFHTLATKNVNVWKESFGFILDSNPYEQKNTTATGNFNNFFTNKAYASDEVLELPVLPEQGWSAGTGRMYIWEKGLDLVKDKPLFGYGLDSFTYNFPHFNIDARAGNNSENTIVDKPHSLYVGIIYGTGIIGALAFFLIIFATAFSGARDFVARNNSKIAVLFGGCLAFFVQALFNDSIPGITPLAFIFMGMLIGQSSSKNNVKESI